MNASLKMRQKSQIWVEQRDKSANPGSTQWASRGGELFWTGQDGLRLDFMGPCLRLVEMVGKILLNGSAQDAGFLVNSVFTILGHYQ